MERLALELYADIVIVMVGGVGSGNTLLNATWEWDGRQWQQITPTTTPSARFDAAMSYDQAHRRMVPIGGPGANGSLGDTWSFDGSRWVSLDAPVPSPRNGVAAVYDPRARAVLLFGGRNKGTALPWGGARRTRR